MRIVSTVPSQTELLYDLGLEKEVVGITKFCIHPDSWFRSKKRIGGTKNLNIEKIIDLKPDLIIANKEENTKEEIEILQQHSEVFVSEIKTIEDNYQLIKEIGKLTQKEEKANRLISETQTALDFTPTHQNKTVVYLIWKKPFMTIGSDTFINSMLEKCGFINMYANQTRYPQTTIEEIVNLKPQYVLLSSEPYPFKEKHILELQNVVPDCKIILADGEAFSWYGSRIIKKSKYLKNMSLL